MSMMRRDHLLAAALVALLTMAAAAGAQAQGMVSSPAAQPSSENAATTEAPRPPQAAKTEAELDARIPLPAPLDMPPPSAKDVTAPEKPVTATAPEKPATPAPVNAATSKETPAQAATEAAIPANPLAEKLRELVTGKFERFIDRKTDRPGVSAFYAARQYAPLWVESAGLTERAKAASAYLAGVAADGLDASDYPTPNLKANPDLQALAEAELKMTDSVLTFARHAQTGRVHFSRIGADILYNPVAPEPADVLAALAQTSDVAQTLDGYNPPHAAYKALKAKLAELRGQPAAAEPQVVKIPDGPILRPGMDDPRVSIVRKRLNIHGGKSDTVYDDHLSEAVKNFQLNAGLEADGMLGPNTLRVLNGGGPRRGDTVNTILANMERWRWLPRDLGKAHVILNIPSFMLKVMNNGALVWETRVVVGKPDTPTPLLSETMKYITVNPTWNVPPSIVYNEYLPLLYEDPTVLSRMGLRVVQNNDGSVHMYQPPGDANALGRLRFNFPNKFLVYQHDTSEKHLFAHDKRAYSHGCMRVQDPLRYAEVLLSIVLPKEGYTQDKLRKMYANEEKEITFPTHIPVHITYQTAYVDEHGKLIIREDIYGRDAKTLAALKGEDRQVADMPMDRRAELQASLARPAVRLPYGVTTDNSRYASSDGMTFFERLFGGGGGRYQPPPPAPVPRGRVYRLN